jgi:hypothetical protein
VLGREVYRDGRFDEARLGREAVFDHGRGGYWATEDKKSNSGPCPPSA